MKVLVVQPGPNFSVADVADGWVKGLRACGAEVVDFNFHDRLSFYSEACKVDETGELVPLVPTPEHAALLAGQGILSACMDWWPDVVLVVSGFFVPPGVYRTLRGRGFKVVLLHTESPYEDDRQTVRAQLAHLNIVNDPTNLDQFPPGSLYIPHAYDPDIHHPADPDPDLASDFCFVGTGYPSRIEFFEQVDWSGIDVCLAGHWKAARGSTLEKYVDHDLDLCCDNSDAARLYASTKVSANLYRREATHTADGWAMGPREVELAACGTFFLRDPRPESNDVLGMLPTFDGPDDFSRRLRWWLTHDDARTEAAALAREAVSGRTFSAHASLVLDAIGV